MDATLNDLRVALRMAEVDLHGRPEGMSNATFLDVQTQVLMAAWWAARAAIRIDPASAMRLE